MESSASLGSLATSQADQITGASLLHKRNIEASATFIANGGAAQNESIDASDSLGSLVTSRADQIPGPSLLGERNIEASASLV